MGLFVKLDGFDFDGDYGQEYEDLAHRVIPGYESLFSMILAVVEPELPRGARVLVVGAGNGIEITTLKASRPDLEILGVDPSAQMLELAEARVRLAGCQEGVTFHHGYAHEVNTAAKFDAATLINVMHFVPDDGGKGALLTDVAQRVQPDSPFVLFDLHGDPTSEEYARYMPAWRRLWAIRGMNQAERGRFSERIRTGIHFASAARILELAREAGFTAPRMFYKSLLYGGWTFRRSPG
ncbi:MAG: class I SAM-dependent methyltransferase [Longimicrobiales bacterium]